MADMTQLTQAATDEAELRALIARQAKAVRDQDLAGIRADHVPPPFSSHGLDAYMATWDGFFAWQAKPVQFDFHEIAITTDSDVAFATAIARCCDLSSGEEVQLDFRLTTGFRNNAKTVGGTAKGAPAGGIGKRSANFPGLMSVTRLPCERVAHGLVLEDKVSCNRGAGRGAFAQSHISKSRCGAPIDWWLGECQKPVPVPGEPSYLWAKRVCRREKKQQILKARKHFLLTVAPPLAKNRKAKALAPWA